MSQSPGQMAEGLTVKRLGLSATVASGQLDGDPADGKTEELRVEIKTTLGMTLRVDIAWLKQIEEDAVSHGQVPVLSFQFIREDGRPRKAWVAVPERFWRTIREALERERI
ncbi:hypothetical protein LCGC14_0504580 [marine sediment metagenome]|uniref:Protein NO VEIN C-terminal domain-containing protein n=1 Tax=marine sediment metagenome TaxID=412755 RepID=A0A0F9VBI9_9ZZZZ